MSATAPTRERRRVRVRVRGTVQGVGFRPYVYRLAHEVGADGFVLNDSRGVLLEVEGAASAVASFLARLEPERPPLSLLEGMDSEELEPTGEPGFAIRDSTRDDTPDAPVAVDTATCADCLREIFDPADRRFEYPFTNCTNCGPRFTIIRGVPYDRPLTTMAQFTMCPACQAEYDDPRDRRFHVQPNACPRCGPSLNLLDRAGEPVCAPGRDALRLAANALQRGRVVAIKGIGGYHLACSADDERAVATLRARKHREDKPFALMAASLEDAAELIELGPSERELLAGPQRPIVLAPRTATARVAASVAPRSPELGVMLAYSPLHHLLLRAIGSALVMTSANASDEPIAYRNDDALARLAAIADLFLVHDRDIQTRADDSVVRVVRVCGRPRTAFLRRSRGYAPSSITLAPPTPEPVLACGAELKSTFCLARADRAWVSHHIGDLENYETLTSFRTGIEHFQELFAAQPHVIAHDMHPDYLSTKYALEREPARLIAVQHHHAHLAACLAEHREPGHAVGAIFDGSGYGADATVWGGEFLLGSTATFERVGKLLAVCLPGGSHAIREPWRMACAWLTAAYDGEQQIPRPLIGRVDGRAWRNVQEMIRTAVNAPTTTSMGRLFDAVAALCSLRMTVNYEGQAAIELEAACDPHERGEYPIAIHLDEPTTILDPRETIRAIVADIDRATAIGVIASRFHRTIARATVAMCEHAASAGGTDLIALSGGVFQNRRLLEDTAAGLQAEGLRVLTPELLPANDAAIAYGQAAIAASALSDQ